jgi:hypothetical protein
VSAITTPPPPTDLPEPLIRVGDFLRALGIASSREHYQVYLCSGRIRAYSLQEYEGAKLCASTIRPLTPAELGSELKDIQQLAQEILGSDSKEYLALDQDLQKYISDLTNDRIDLHNSPPQIYRGRFTDVSQRISHYLSYKIERDLYPQLERLKQLALNKGGAIDITSKGWEKTVTINSRGDCWLRVAEIAKGNFKQILLNQRLLTGEYVAVARPLTTQKKDLTSLQREHKIYQRFRGRMGIAQMHAVQIIDPRKIKQLANKGLVLRYYPFTLTEFIEKEKQPWLNEIDTLSVAKQLSQGLSTLHQSNVYHRDIKPDNILAVYNSARGLQGCLADFGLAVSDPTESTIYKLAGSILYLSPGIFSIKPGTLRFQRLLDHTQIKGALSPREASKRACDLLFAAADVWALGLTLYQLIHHQYPSWLPIASSTQIDALKKIKKISRRSQVQHGYFQPVDQGSLAFIVWKMLDPDLLTRPSAKELSSEIETLLVSKMCAFSAC